MLKITDLDSNRTFTFSSDAAGYEAAFNALASDKDRADLAKALEEGCVFESWSGKSTAVIERDREPLRFWLHLCSLIETDNQVWEAE